MVLTRRSLIAECAVACAALAAPAWVHARKAGLSTSGSLATSRALVTRG
jgi:hypothetical protein